MTIDVILIAVSLSAAIAYGAVLTRREASLGRTVVKATAVAALAVLAFVFHHPWPLVAGLALSALGDAFLAGDAERWLPAGLGTFLLAHVSYIWLFRTQGYGLGVLASEPWRGAGAGAAVIAGVVMLVWLWRSIGPLRPAVALYAAALALMVFTALTLPLRDWPAMPGAVLFLISDALLSAELFKGFRTRWSGPVVWATYYGAQGLIAYAFLR
jgi:uncharacterized membrane protein YhhN